MVRMVKVVPHHPDWQHQFEQESHAIREAMSPNLLAIHHIGSTAIPHIYAKPIIDMLAEVADIAQVNGQTPHLEHLGYEALGEYGIPGRRYFRKYDETGDRTHHLHVFQTGSADIHRHLAFRDYMIAHPDAAQAYSQLKQQLAAAHPNDIEAYMDGKDSFIQVMQQNALNWQCS
jgi:GrpB-like predicted nucleotidyltransferase (UPF0157 family)